MTDEKLLNAALWFALEKAGDKLKDEKERDALAPGTRLPIAISLDACIAGHQMDREIEGFLQVAFDGTTSTKCKPPAERVLAIALSYVPKTRRAQLLESGIDEVVDAKLLAQAEEWVARNTSHETKSRRGSVSFEFE